MPTQSDCGVNRFMRPDYANGESGGISSSPVSSGPNEGLHYVSNATFYSHRGSAVNSHLRSSSSTTYTSSDPGQASCSPCNWYNANDSLGGASSQAFIAGVLNHEGYGTLGTNGHQSFYESEAGKPDHDPRAAVEDLVSRDLSTLIAEVERQINDLSSALESAVEAKGEPSGNFGPATRWAWETGLQKWLSLTWDGG